MISDDPYSLNTQFVYSSSSAFAKAAAINDASSFTEVYATALPTEVIANAPISQVTLDSTNKIAINGAIISSFTVLDNDAGISSINGPRIAEYTSFANIDVSGTSQALLDQDIRITPGATGVWDDGIDIRPTLDTDDSVSIVYESASAIAKAAAINDSTQFTGVTATVEPTIIVAPSPINQVTLDSTNKININGVVITSFTVLDNDAGVSSINGPRVAQYTSHYNIDVSGPSQALVGEDVIITPGASGVWDDRVRIRQTVDSDDTVSTDYNSASAIAKAAAINDSTQFTGVTATVEPTVVVANSDITQVTLDSTNLISINGVLITGFTVLSNDAGISSVNGPRIAQYTSSTNIDVLGTSQALFDQDVVIIPGASGVWDDRIDIRPTLDSDDTISTIYNSASAIAKAAAINDSTQYTGVSATVEPTSVVGSADIRAVDLDSFNYIIINGKEISGITVKDNDATSSLRNQINNFQSATGVTASLDSNNRLILTAIDGRNIELTTSGSATKLGLSAAPGTTVSGGKITLTSDETFEITGNAIGKLGDIGGQVNPLWLGTS